MSALMVIFFSFFLLGYPSLAGAGCGCDKPPPVAATVIPQVAFPGLSVTLFHSSLQEGQTWTVVFQNGGAKKTVVAPVLLKRAVTDATGATLEPQLTVAVPPLPVGQTSLVASSGGVSFTVAKEAFLVISPPLMISEQDSHYTVRKYKTVVGEDGHLYVSVSGLDTVCKAMEFQIFSPRFPLRVTQMTIFNAQGFFIDSFSPQSVDHFVVEPGTGAQSDRLHYFRHSFEQYCADHQSGGSKEVEASDPNWHLDGTPHVDYSTILFAIAGNVGTRPLVEGRRASLVLDILTRLGDGSEPWETEREEELVFDDDDDDDD